MTDFSCSILKKDLQEVLNQCFPVVPNKDIFPLLKNFHIQLFNNPSRLIVSATDLQVGVVSVTTNVSIDTPGAIVVPAFRLMAIMRECADDVVVLSSVNNTVTVSVDDAKWVLRVPDLGAYPDFDVLAQSAWEPLNRDVFLEALDKVRYAASRDSMQASLMMVDMRNGLLRAADGVRFQQLEFDQAHKIKVGIPIAACDILVKMIQTHKVETIHVCDAPAAILFKVGYNIVHIKKLTASFPPMDEQLLKPSLTNDLELVVSRDALTRAVRRMQITTDSESNAVVLHLDEDALAVTSKDKTGSWAEENLPATWTGKNDRRAAFTAHHLLEMLRGADEECHFFLGPDKKTKPSALLLRGKGKSAAVLSQVRHDWP